MPDGSPVSRRRLLELLSISSLGGIAGCTGERGESSPTRPETPNSTPPRTATATPRTTDTPTETPSETETPTETPRENPDTIFIHPSGSAYADGTKEDPIDNIQGAVDAARPGETVHVLSGRYEETVVTRRSGYPDNPITITGPPDAVVTGNPDNKYANACTIRHSHIHLTGLTIDGLKNPSKPDDPLSYMSRGVACLPEEPEYLKDIVIKPHAVGNARGSLIDLNFVENVEVGEFEVIGPAGLLWWLTGKEGHWAEIVYVGQAPPTNLNAIDFNDELSESGLDLSHDIHIHHIDNSAGHEHSEIANTKLGTYDVLVEYCTDAGGSQNNETYPAASVRLQSYDATVRWCKLRNGNGVGVEVGSWKARDRQAEKSESDLIEAEKRGGRDNAIYGNQVLGFNDLAFKFPNSESGQTPEAQEYFCGNEYDGLTEGHPSTACPDGLPEGDGIGHLGGDSPWSGEGD